MQINAPNDAANHNDMHPSNEKYIDRNNKK